MDAQTQQVIAWLKANGSNYGAWKAQDNIYKQLLGSLPRFNKNHENLKEATVLYVGGEASQFEQGEVNIVVYCYDEASGCGDFWRGSMANTYGQNATKTRKEKTLEVLERCGITDIRTVYTLIGKKVPVWIQEKVSQRGTTYYPVATLGSSGIEVPPAISLESLFGTAAAPAAPAVTAATVAPAAQPQVGNGVLNPNANPYA